MNKNYHFKNTPFNGKLSEILKNNINILVDWAGF